MSVQLTRGELVALKETIELTPRFEGRAEARDAISGLLRNHRPYSTPLSLHEETVTALIRNVVVPIDLLSAAIHSKLKVAAGRAVMSDAARPDTPQG